MTYDLAKKLKEAGFPQENTEKTYCEAEDSFCGHIKQSKRCIDCGFKKHIAYPNLSELIEACGDKFNCLKKSYNCWECGEWDNGYGDSGGFFDVKTEGQTPEEAVASLYISLNSDKIK